MTTENLTEEQIRGEGYLKLMDAFQAAHDLDDADLLRIFGIEDSSHTLRQAHQAGLLSEEWHIAAQDLTSISAYLIGLYGATEKGQQTAARWLKYARLDNGKTPLQILQSGDADRFDVIKTALQNRSQQITYHAQIA